MSPLLARELLALLDHPALSAQTVLLVAGTPDSFTVAELRMELCSRDPDELTTWSGISVNGASLRMSDPR